MWDLENQERQLMEEIRKAQEASESLPDLEDKLALVRDRMAVLKHQTHYDEPLDSGLPAEA